MDGIPVLCRVNLKGMEPPLQIHIVSTPGDLNIYCSYRSKEPTSKDHDFAFHNQKKIQIPAEKPNSMNSFKHDQLFMAFSSHKTIKAKVTATFHENEKSKP